jgi:hypothetical protein
VNKLYAAKGLEEPLLTWGLLVPGYNFVTGIRQIHFLSKFWAMERGKGGRERRRGGGKGEGRDS